VQVVARPELRKPIGEVKQAGDHREQRRFANQRGPEILKAGSQGENECRAGKNQGLTAERRMNRWKGGILPHRHE
jgi:hypothetical protein